MERGIRQHRRVEEREAVLAKFDAGGMTVQEFCGREGISASSLNRWRAARAAGPATVTPPRSSAAFVDIGAVGGGRERFELRLELGDGLVLQLARR